MSDRQPSLLRDVIRDACVSIVRRSPMLSLALVAAGQRPRRTTEQLDAIYGDQWRRFEGHLEEAATLDHWLRIPGVDDVRDSVQIDGELRYTALDHVGYLARVVTETVQRELPGVRSIIEYGCGVGRNVLALHRTMPGVAVWGYELTHSGVTVAQRAAAKFGVPARFAQLDYVHDPPKAYVLGSSDVALTVYSLVDVAEGAETALRNMLAHTERALVLVEPAAERYPFSYRGLLGRAYVRTRRYLQGLDALVEALPARRVHRRLLATSNNPLMYPTVYVLEK